METEKQKEIGNKIYNKRYRLIKKLKDKYSQAEDFEDYFKSKERQIFPGSCCAVRNYVEKYSSIKHPNIPELYFYEQNGFLNVVYENCPSINLISRLEKVQCDVDLHQDYIIYWLYQVVSGIDALHRNNILHKRISKRWIAFKNDEIKINFYPYSSVANKDGLVERDKPSNYVYNAPEFNSNYVTLKYDLWCCGWLLYDMSWVDSDSEKLLASVQDFNNWSKPSLPDGFSNELKQIFDEMTKLDPNDRKSACDLLKHPLFTNFDYYENLDKEIFNDRYRKLEHTESRQFFEVFDHKERTKKWIKRFLKSDSKVFEIYNEYACLSSYFYFVGIEDIFDDELFLYTIESGIDMDLRGKLESLKGSRCNYKEQIIEWFVQLLTAVNALHSNNILHKKICRSYIVFKNEMIKLDYYENSSKLKSKEDKVKITDDIAYNSPEILNVNEINLKYDIWCLGWVFFEMCTIDFPRYKLEDVRDFNVWEKPDLPDFFPVELNKVFRKMMSINECDRPTTKEILDEPFFKDYENIIKNCKKSEDPDLISNTKFKYEPIDNIPFIQEYDKDNLFNNRYEKTTNNGTSTNVLGRGAFGVVYLVLDLKDNKKKKALKEVWIKDDINYIKKTISEVKIVKELSENDPHENIVKYFDHFYKIDSLNYFDYYMVFEYCEGPNLDEKLKALKAHNQKLDILTVVDWMEQLASAINHLHTRDKKIIHRDIKPGNVFLHKESNRTVVKLGDFGVSRAFNKSTQNSLSIGVGTLYYMSPEILNNKDYDTEVDIWSFGCVIYEMFTFNKAFEGGSISDTVNKIQNMDAPDLICKESLISRLFKKMVSKDPSRRPNSLKCLEVIKQAKVLLKSKLDLDDGESFSDSNIIRLKRKIEFSDIKIEYFGSESVVYEDFDAENPELFKERYKKLNKFPFKTNNKGAFYNVLDVNTNTKKTLKIIDLSKLDEVCLNELAREVLILKDIARLNETHSNILKFFHLHLNESEKTASFVYENFDLVSLKDKIESIKLNKTKLPLKTTLNWMSQISFAIDYLHSNKIILRYIKPDDIYFDNERLIIGGFENLMYSSDLYQYTFNIKDKDVSYLSPEIIEMREYDFKTDIWSIGCIFHEILTLNKPFSKDDHQNTLDAILRIDPDLVEISDFSLKDLIKSMLHKDSALRPDSIGLIRYFYRAINYSQ